MKEKKKIAILGALLVMAALVWYYESREKSASANASVTAKSSYAPLPVENPGLHWDKLDATRQTEYKSNGRDLFSEIAPPPPTPIAKQEPQSVVPSTPAPPPLPTLPANMKYYGYGTIPNGTARRAFLSDGEDVYIVGEGDTLLGKYRIVKIGNANLDFEELATGRRGSTTLDEQGGLAPS
jgi:hypothetical protein